MELGLLSTAAPALDRSGGGPARRRTGASLWTRRSPAWLGIAPFVIYVLLFLGAPLYEVVKGAFQGTTGAATFSNISTTFSQPQFLDSFKSSLILSLWTSAAGAIFGTWLAYAVVQSSPRSPLRRIVATSSGVFAYFGGVPLAFFMIAAYGRPGTGVVIDFLGHLGIHPYPHFQVASLAGLGLCYVYFQVPLMVILITPALEGLRPQWREAAAGLGATSWRYWRHIGGPVLAPAVLGSFLLLFGNAFASYATALALLNGTVSLVPSQITFELSGNVLVNQTGVGLALGLEMIAVTAIVMIFYGVLSRRANRWNA
ncbi:MAG TPA: ABC transporter permease subunit [Solirubrobacteraceae bacterium]|nr:ABC transporter permease subunit [Solirubrobacteraceae bacterium]